MSQKNKNYRGRNTRDGGYGLDNDKYSKKHSNKGKRRRDKRNQGSYNHYNRDGDQEDTLYADRIDDYNYEDKSDKYHNSQGYSRNWKHDRSQDQFKNKKKRRRGNDQYGGRRRRSDQQYDNISFKKNHSDYNRYNQQQKRYKDNRGQNYNNRQNSSRYNNDHDGGSVEQYYESIRASDKQRQENQDRDRDRGNRRKKSHQYSQRNQILYETELQKTREMESSNTNKLANIQRTKSDNFSSRTTQNSIPVHKTLIQDIETPNKSKDQSGLNQQKEKEKEKTQKNSHSQQNKPNKRRSSKQETDESKENNNKLKEKEYEILVKLPKNQEKSIRIDISSESLEDHIEQQLSQFCKGNNICQEMSLHLKKTLQTMF